MGSGGVWDGKLVLVGWEVGQESFNPSFSWAEQGPCDVPAPLCAPARQGTRNRTAKGDSASIYQQCRHWPQLLGCTSGGLIKIFSFVCTEKLMFPGEIFDKYFYNLF